MNPTTDSDQSIGFAGLAAHEKNTINCVQQIYPHRLHRIRDIADPSEADVIFADPGTPEGQAALSHQDKVHIITVQDRRQPMVPGAAETLYRPLRPRAVIESLNNVGMKLSPSPTPKLVSESAELSQLLRKAMDDNSDQRPLLLSEQGQPWLVIDPARDRVRGDLDRLSADRLVARDRQVFNHVSPEEASQRLIDRPEAPLYRTLWKLASELGDRTRLYGNDTNARVRLERWPNFSEIRVAGNFVRAVSLIRHSSFTETDARDRTGLPESALLVLLNGCWLTGELTSDPALDRPLPEPTSMHSSMNVSVLARIRSRLGGS